jgi:hypothetical protein
VSACQPRSRSRCRPDVELELERRRERKPLQTSGASGSPNRAAPRTGLRTTRARDRRPDAARRLAGAGRSGQNSAPRASRSSSGVSVRIAASAIRRRDRERGPESRNSPKRASAISAHATATAAALVAITGPRAPQVRRRRICQPALARRLAHAREQ